jgi:chromosome segregation ATPase
MRTQTLATGILAIAAMTAGNGLVAQVQRSGGEAQKFMQQYQQLSAERTAMQAQLADMKKQLDAAKTDLAAMKKERDALKAKNVEGTAAAITQANNAKQAAELSLEQSKQRTNELIGRFRETVQALKETETDRNKARKELTERNAAFDTCALNNVQLADINREILDRYEHVGLFTKTSAAEPFTRITRTRLENLADEYRARAQELRVKKPAAP